MFMLNLFSAGESNQILLFVLLGLMVVVLVVLPMFTNKKKAKAVNQLLSSVKVGDKIKTIGGIIGTVVSVKEISPVEKAIVIESGVGENMTTIELDIQAVYMILNNTTAAIVDETPFAEDVAIEVKAEEVEVVEKVVAVKVEDVEVPAGGTKKIK